MSIAAQQVVPPLTAMKQARQIIWRYRHETPLGNQPHMIAHEADQTIERIDQAIAELESQEPVAVWELFEDGWDSIADPEWMESLPIGTKLYTHPPKRTEQEPLANELAQLKKEIALLKYKLWDCEEKSKPMQGQ